MFTCTIKMIRMIDLSPKPQGVSIYGTMALLAHVLAHSVRLHSGVAFMAQGTTLKTKDKIKLLNIRLYKLERMLMQQVDLKSALNSKDF